MNVYYDFDSLRKITNPVITMGSYDGVHAGHKEIIRQINTIAKEIGGESVIITFSPHPREILFGTPQKLINTLDEKINLLEQQGVDVLIIIPFTLEFGDIEPYDFVKEYLFDKLGVSKLVIGFNHHFGKKNKGDIHLLRSLQDEFNFEVIQIPQHSVGSQSVSSTIVRNALSNGHISDVNKYIGYQYFINGTISSDGAIYIDNKNKILPPTGAYNVILNYMNTPTKTTLHIADNGDLKVDNIDCKYITSSVIINFI